MKCEHGHEVTPEDLAKGFCGTCSVPLDALQLLSQSSIAEEETSAAGETEGSVDEGASAIETTEIPQTDVEETVVGFDVGSEEKVEADAATQDAAGVVIAQIAPGTEERRKTDEAADDAQGQPDAPHMDAELAAVVEALALDVPTFAVIGAYDVGKTFFIQKLLAIASNELYEVSEFTYNAGESGPTRVADSLRAELPDAEFGSTNEIHIYTCTGRKAPFRVIDVPGEFFEHALADKRGLDARDQQRVRRIYPVLAACHGVMLVVPAPQIFGGFNAKVERTATLLGQVRTLCNLVEALKGQDNFRDAVARILAMPTAELAAFRLEDNRISRLPASMLMSQADKCFGAGRDGRLTPTAGVWPREDDPFGSLAAAAPKLANNLVGGFERTRVDFVTSYEGCAEDNKRLRGDEPSLGVWPAARWMLSQITRPLTRERPARFSRRWFGNLLQHGHAAPDDAVLTEWVIDIRKSADRAFGDALDDR